MRRLDKSLGAGVFKKGKMLWLTTEYDSSDAKAFLCEFKKLSSAVFRLLGSIST